MKLGEVGTIRSGLVLSRKQSKEASKYCYPLLNFRSILPDGSIDKKQLEVFYTVEPLKGEYLSQTGDLVIRLTAPYTAVLIDDETSGIVISSNFAIVRMATQEILPEYLFWRLNTAKVKRQIFESTTSNVLGAVKTKYFQEYELEALPVEQQRKLAQINFLAKRESQLLKKLAEQKEIYYAGLLDQACQSM